MRKENRCTLLLDQQLKNDLFAGAVECAGN